MRLLLLLLTAIGRELDTVVFALALGLLAYGAFLIYRPAGFVLPGLILTWVVLPSRPPLVSRPPKS